ncbi:hypothetical protein BAY61_28300 [Prauserella marina]|uniref:Uncharacterized protein n=1 Tax=Prauserella marina TaxID=530584 RepID=A0A222VWP7_9PSEU|nr:hypothetical protein [Prauserella marina]ASR38262.1 hypothetical protein BAY61_28300 [Prauserella marina]PWV78541.1 hypothetical protein DES30_104276 [Prauserella marina]SDC88321.1 hypothetical protein SAMN05421630_104275 [Prauserella marina]
MTDEKSKEAKEETEKTGLRPAQVAAAALAAVTAAFLGSSLGVYGTVLGAGLISVLTTVGSEFYLRSFTGTKEATKKAKAAASAAITDGKGWTVKLAQPGPGAKQGHRAGGIDQPTTRFPVPASPHGDPDAPTVYLPKPGGNDTDDDESGRRKAFNAAWWKRRWPLIVGTSAVAFVIGMAVITGVEGITGKSVSGGQGSTVGQLVGKGSGTTGGDEHREESPDQQQTPTQQAPATTSESPESPAPTSESQQPGESSSTEQTPTRESPSSQSEAPESPPADIEDGSGTGGGAEVTPNAVP